jgi:hypothetical protein
VNATTASKCASPGVEPPKLGKIVEDLVGIHGPCAVVKLGDLLEARAEPLSILVRHSRMMLLKAEGPPERAFQGNSSLSPAVTQCSEYAMKGRPEGRIRTGISLGDDQVLCQLSYPGDVASRPRM